MDYYRERQDQAIKSLTELLSLPDPESRFDLGSEGFFDPWDLFPLFYGSYSSDFDTTMIEVLESLQNRKSSLESLAHQIFREALCRSHFCDYGTSPRVCFATTEFTKLLPELIRRWKNFSKLQWEES